MSGPDATGSGAPGDGLVAESDVDVAVRGAHGNGIIISTSPLPKMVDSREGEASPTVYDHTAKRDHAPYVPARLASQTLLCLFVLLPTLVPVSGIAAFHRQPAYRRLSSRSAHTYTDGLCCLNMRFALSNCVAGERHELPTILR